MALNNKGCINGERRIVDVNRGRAVQCDDGRLKWLVNVSPPRGGSLQIACRALCQPRVQLCPKLVFFFLFCLWCDDIYSLW